MLDADQERAVNFRDQNLLILAGAGAGKTRTLVSRAISLAEEVGFTRLMLVTFTKKAAQTLTERIKSTSRDPDAYKNAYIGTFHNIAWRLVREYGHLLNIDEEYAIMDQIDSERLMKLAAFRYNTNHKELCTLNNFSRNSGISVNQLIQTPRYAHLGRIGSIKEIISSYNERSKRSKRLDFHHILEFANTLLKKHPQVRQELQERFSAILVDEYQDTNRLQARILQSLNNGTNITVVGDDAQSIYSFNAATIQNILSFEQEFNATKITLSTNYRNPPRILELAENSVMQNSEGMPRDIRPSLEGGSTPILLTARNQVEEAVIIGEAIGDFVDAGTDPEKIAILYRANRLSAALQIELQRLGISFSTSGDADFFALPHIKYVMHLLRLISTSEDTVSISAMQELLEFGNVGLLESAERRAIKNQCSIWEIIEEEDREDGDTQTFQDFSAFLNELQEGSEDEGSVTEILNKAIDRLNEPLRLQAGAGQVWVTWQEDLAILRNISTQFNSINDFVNTVTLQNVEEGNREKGIQLSTLHAAKGLEWDHVFIIGLVEWWFPMNMAIRDYGKDEEERRLFYVGATRAKKSLRLTTFREQTSKKGAIFNSRRSRFIDEIDNFLEMG